jgi:hypothetical protein
MHFTTHARTVYIISAYSSFVKMCSIFHNTPTMSLSTVTTANWRFTLIDIREGRTTLGVKSKLLYSEIALSWKPLGIGHMYILNFSLRMAGTMTSQNIDLSYWDSLWRWYNNTIIVLWTLSSVLFFNYLKHKISETGFYLRLQVKATQWGPIDIRS